MTQRQNIIGFVVLSSIFIGWLVYSELKPLDSENKLSDSDNDGVINAKDKCPNEAGDVALYGCPDSDKDGLSDIIDQCPEVKGVEGNNGCPTVILDPNKLVEIQYKGVIYSIKQGFISKEGMPFAQWKWRYYKGSWQNQYLANKKSKWRRAKEKDVVFILSKNGKVKTSELYNQRLLVRKLIGNDLA